MRLIGIESTCSQKEKTQKNEKEAHIIFFSCDIHGLFVYCGNLREHQAGTLQVSG